MTTDKTPKPASEETLRVRTTGDIEVSTYLEIAKQKGGQKPAPAKEAVTDVEREAIIVIDFGSQYSMLIARRVREAQVYCELVAHDTPWEKIAPLNPRGYILSGGPASVYEPNAPLAPPYVYESGLPVLGICYGMQAITKQMGGLVAPGTKREFGHAIMYLSDSDIPLFAGLPESTPVWMSHGDKIETMPAGFSIMAYTENSPIAIMGNRERNVYGLQFHPEVAHTPEGKTLLKNFIYNVCGCRGNWTMGNFINDSVGRIKEQVGNGKVICALSGGVDSAVVATLIHRAIGDQLTCIFVNNGLLRREEVERTLNVFRLHLGMNIIFVDATERFLNRLKGVNDPEVKRKSIGEEFIKVFEEEAGKIGKVDFLAQGTLYPDVIESVSSVSKASAKIKTHHNVGGLPAKMTLKLIEPLRYLFKDEVRQVGLQLGMPEEMVWRQPFPGPGLAIRVIGEVTREKLEILRSADFILMNEIKKAKLYRQLWQSFAILTDVKSVGVMGDFRTYGYLVAIRAVTSEDAMTADWARLPYDLLAKISNRIVNEVPGVNRVVYDITSKPPSTIEWE
jgi:GMP synthase (glutamine-hydrolysing)